MCKHVINAQVSIFFANSKWYDCHECYLELEGALPDLDGLARRLPLACKRCRQLFHKDMTIFNEADATCPHCGNKYLIPAMTPKSCLLAEAAEAIGMLRRDLLANAAER